MLRVQEEEIGGFATHPAHTQTGPGWAKGHRREEAIQKLLNQYQCAGCVQIPLIVSSTLQPFRAEVILSILTLSRTEGAAGLPKARRRARYLK